MFDGGESWYNTVRHLICFLRRSNLTAPPSLLWEWQHTKALVYFWRKIHSIVCGTSSRYSIAGQRFKNKKSNLTRRIDNAPDHHTFFTKKTCTNYGKKKSKQFQIRTIVMLHLLDRFRKTSPGALFEERSSRKPGCQNNYHGKNVIVTFSACLFLQISESLQADDAICIRSYSSVRNSFPSCLITSWKAIVVFFFQLLFAAFTESVVAPTPRQDHW